ncbi:MAG: BrnT family toxin [Nitrospirales bacterium]|nr:BrnT family toxin [Nitrospirales bacterium]
MRFEWNSSKAQFNFSKHGISFEEATTIFGDPLSITSPDPDHSQEEARWITIGVSTNLKTIVVVHTDRSEAVRIISTRLATKREKGCYEHGI